MNPQIKFLLQKAIESIEFERYDTAELFLNQILKIDSKNSEAYRYLGVIRGINKNYRDAVYFFQKSLEISPKNAVTFCNVGIIQTKLKNFEEAKKLFDKSIDLMPNNYEAWSNRGILNYETRNFDAAMFDYQEALRINNQYLPALMNFGNLLVALGERNKAKDIYQTVINTQPKFYDARYNLALLHLYEKNFQKGWKEYEYRWQSSDFKSYQLVTAKNRWDGIQSDLKVLIWGEQGIGDQILYGLMLSDAAKVTKKLTVAINRKILPIFQRAFTEIDFIAIGDLETFNDYDQQLPIGSLGMIFRNTIDKFVENRAYITDDSLKTRAISEKFECSIKYKIAFAWRSSNDDVGAEKSIPLEEFIKIFDGINSKIELIPIQSKIDKDEMKLINNDERFFNLNLDYFNDIDNLISVIKISNLIVTTSSTIAHIAGSIGKPTLLLVPFSIGRFWYWHAEDNSSIWYPSITVIEQKSFNNWGNVISEANYYLKNLTYE